MSVWMLTISFGNLIAAGVSALNVFEHVAYWGFWAAVTAAVRASGEFVRVAASDGVREAITRRDGPFGDYSQAPREEQPRKRSELGL